MGARAIGLEVVWWRWVGDYDGGVEIEEIWWWEIGQELIRGQTDVTCKVG